MDRRNLAFDKVNFILLAIGMAIVILGFLLMSGAGSNENTFDMDIFSTRRIVVAPTVTLIGFLSNHQIWRLIVPIFNFMYRGKCFILPVLKIDCRAFKRRIGTIAIINTPNAPGG